MRNRVLTLLATTAMLAACQQPPAAELTDDERSAIAAEVNATVAQVFDARNSHDGAAVMSHYLQTDGFSYVGVNDVKLGYEIFARLAEPWYPAHPDVTFEHEIVQTEVLSPTSAVVLARGRSTEAESLTWTQVYVKRDGKWLIAHEHTSWPVCVDAPEPHPFTTAPPQ